MKKTNACLIALLNRGRPARDAPSCKARRLQLRWETERHDSVNHRAASPLRVDGKLPADDFQPLPHAGQAEPGPSHRLVRVKTGARILDCQLDVVDLTLKETWAVATRCA